MPINKLYDKFEGINVSLSSSLISQRRGINLIPGTNVGITVADNYPNVDITISSTGGGGGGGTNTLSGTAYQISLSASGVNVLSTRDIVLGFPDPNFVIAPGVGVYGETFMGYFNNGYLDFGAGYGGDGNAFIRFNAWGSNDGDNYIYYLATSGHWFQNSGGDTTYAKIDNVLTNNAVLYSNSQSISPVTVNITSTKKYLQQYSSGVPSFQQISASDISGSALTSSNDTNVTITLGGSPSTAVLNATSISLGWTGSLAISRGGTGLGTTPTDGQILIGKTSTNAYVLATISGTTNQISVSNGSGTITLSTPQNLHTSATPQFGRLFINGGAQGTASVDLLVMNGNSGSNDWAISFYDAGIPGMAAKLRYTTAGYFVIDGVGASGVYINVGANTYFNVTSTLTTISNNVSISSGHTLTLQAMSGTQALYQSSGVITAVTSNTTGTNKYLQQVSSGVPSFQQVAVGDLSGASALTASGDTNVTISLGGTPATSLLVATSITIGWTGTLAAGRLNSSVVQGITNDTNVTGSISSQTLTLGWSGTLAISRGGTALSSTPTDGQLLIGNTSTNAYVLATLTGTTNRVTVTNGSGTITLSGPQDLNTTAKPAFNGLGLGQSGTISNNFITFSSFASSCGLNCDRSGSGSAAGALSITSEGGKYGATDAAGGDLILSCGIGTGAGREYVRIKSYSTLTTGTTDQTQLDRMVIGCMQALTNNSATAVCNCTLASNSNLGVIISYCIEVTNGSDYQVERGMVTFTGVNKGGSFTMGTPSKFGNLQSLSSGTLTITWSITGANPAVIKCNANSSLTPSTGYPRLTYHIENYSQQSISIQ